MSYPSVEVKAWYDIQTNNIDIGFTCLNSFLKNIPQENLDTTGEYVKPQKHILKDIKKYFENNINIKRIEKESKKANPENYAGIKEFEIVIGLTYLNHNGEIDNYGHFTQYNLIGPSQRRIKKVFSKK